MRRVVVTGIGMCSPLGFGCDISWKNLVNSKVSNKVLSENIINIMKTMLPFTPHLANECLELLKCKNHNQWPSISKKSVLEEVKIAIQINGKTRDVISIKIDLTQKEVENIILKNSKIKKYVDNKKIIKTIFVKNKILNYIIAN